MGYTHKVILIQNDKIKGCLASYFISFKLVNSLKKERAFYWGKFKNKKRRWTVTILMRQEKNKMNLTANRTSRWLKPVKRNLLIRRIDSKTLSLNSHVMVPYQTPLIAEKDSVIFCGVKRYHGNTKFLQKTPHILA